MEHVTLSAGVVMVRKESGEWKYLFLRAYRNWDFPKGEVEPERTLLKQPGGRWRRRRALRILDFRWGKSFKETLPYRSGGKKVARYYIAETSQSESDARHQP